MKRMFIPLGFALVVGLFFLALGIRNAPARFTGRVAFEINWDLAPVLSLKEQDQAAKLQAVRFEVLGVLTGPWPEKDQLRLVKIANPSNRSSTGLVRPNVKVTAKDSSKLVSHVFIEVGHADPDAAGALVKESLSIAKRLTQSQLGKHGVSSSLDSFTRAAEIKQQRSELAEERQNLMMLPNPTPQQRMRIREIDALREQLEWSEAESGIELLFNGTKSLFGIPLPVVQPIHVVKNSKAAYWIATAGVSCVRALLAGGFAWLSCAVWAKFRGSRSVPPPLPPQLSK